MLQLEPGSVAAGLRVERELGRGAYGVVYLAEDELIGRHVALKVIGTPSSQPDAADRALREARAVGRLKSPHIVTLHRVHPFEDESGWMLEMEFIAGGSLTELLDEQPRLEVGRAVGILRSVLRALQVAHEAGVVHGDIKPGNVLIETSGHVKLADFGLSWMKDDQSLSASMHDGPVGTPMYMAPEVIMGERGGMASDLWSTGIVLYRMLAGQLPFRARTLHELFFSVQNAAPAPLPIGVPAALESLALRLLQKLPGDRPPSAAAVLADLERLESGRAAREPRAATAVVSAVPALFGRSAEVAQLSRLLDALEDGRGSAVLIAGEAGSGKTALVKTLLADADRRGMLRAEAAITALEGALRPLLRAADRIAPVHEGSGLPPRLVHELLEGRGGGTLQNRQQIAWAIEQLFVELAERQPVVLTIENAHQADAEDLKLFRELARRFAGSPVLMAVTWRTYDIETSTSDSRGLGGFHELASLEGMEHIALGPLEPEAIYQLLEHRSEAARVDAEVAQRVIDLSEGNPLFAVELKRHLEEQGAIILAGSSLRQAPAWDGPGLPTRFHELVACRLAGLTDGQRELLDVAAVDGRAFDGEALEAVLQRPLLVVLRELQRLYRERHLIEPHGDGYRFTSSVVHEVIYEETAPALRRAIHRQLAEHLEGRGDSVVSERLGQHWERAGDPTRARPHLMRAAVGAAQRLEVRRLVDLCERAGMTPERIDGNEALAYIDTLLHLAPAYDSLERPEQWERLAEPLIQAARRAGDRQTEMRVLARQLFSRETRFGTDAQHTAALLSVAEGLGPCVERGRSYYFLGLGAKFRGDLTEAERWLRRADEEYLALGETGYHGEVLHQLGALAWRADRFDEAEDLFAQAAGISASLGRQINAAASEVNRAMVRFETGRFDGTADVLERAVHTLTLEGSPMAASAAAFWAQVLYAEGDLERAALIIDGALDAIADTSYLSAVESVRREQAHLAAVRGVLPEAGESLDHARRIAESREHLFGRVWVACLDAQLQCFFGDPAAAAAAARSACELAATSEEESTRDEPKHWLPEAVLYGLDPAAVPDADDEFGQALRAFADPTGEIVVPEQLPPRRRAAMRVVAGLLSSEAARRRGDLERARREADEALGLAERLGHVWLEARLLSQLYGLTGERARLERRDALLSRIADGLDTSMDRRRLLEAWAADPSR